MEPVIGFCRAVRIGSHIWVAGTAPIAPDGSAAGKNDPYRQTLRCIEIAKAAIEKAGGSLSDVVRTRVMLTDMSNWREAARAHGEAFVHIQPATTFFEVGGFIDPDWLVEIEFDCFIADSASKGD